MHVKEYCDVPLTQESLLLVTIHNLNLAWAFKVLRLNTNMELNCHKILVIKFS